MPASPPVPDGAAEAGRPPGLPEGRSAPPGALRGVSSCLEPSPGSGTGPVLPAVGPEQRTAHGLHVALLHTRTNVQPRDSLDIKKALITII